MIRTVDKNGDGKINYSEFRVMMGAHPLIMPGQFSSASKSYHGRAIYMHKKNVSIKGKRKQKRKFKLELLFYFRLEPEAWSSNAWGRAVVCGRGLCCCLWQYSAYICIYCAHICKTLFCKNFCRMSQNNIIHCQNRMLLITILFMLSDHHNHNHNRHQNQNYCFFFASSRTIPGEKSSQAGWAKVEVENPGKLDPQEIEFKFHDQIFANLSLRWGPDVRAQPSCYT